MEASWAPMRGRFWQSMWLFGCTLIPLFVLMFVLMKVGLPKPPAVPPISPPTPAPPPVTKLLLIGRGLLGVVQAFAAALAASGASLLYGWMKPRA